MFSLLSGLVEWAASKEEVRLLVLGLDGAGKTTLLHAARSPPPASGGGAARDPPPKTRPTVGLNVGRLEAAGAAVMLWDLGGAPGLRVIWDRYLRDAHAIIFVVDAADRARWPEARAALDRVAGSPDAAGAPLLVLANKTDAPGAADPAEVAAALGPAAETGPRGAPAARVLGASAVRGDGVAAAVAWVAGKAATGPRADALRQRPLS